MIALAILFLLYLFVAVCVFVNGYRTRPTVFTWKGYIRIAVTGFVWPVMFLGPILDVIHIVYFAFTGKELTEDSDDSDL
jgi:hypothetical protein